MKIQLEIQLVANKIIEVELDKYQVDSIIFEFHKCGNAKNYSDDIKQIINNALRKQNISENIINNSQKTISNCYYNLPELQSADRIEVNDGSKFFYFKDLNKLISSSGSLILDLDDFDRYGVYHGLTIPAGMTRKDCNIAKIYRGTKKDKIVLETIWRSVNY